MSYNLSTGGPSQPGPNQNRALLVIIAVFAGIVALGTLMGFGFWAYATWTTQEAVNDLLSGDASTDDFSGTWTGTVAPGDGDVRLVVTSSDRLDGEITFTYEYGSCTESWIETKREFGSVYIEQKYVGGSIKCIDAEYLVRLSGNTMRVESNWTSTGDSFSMMLHKSS